MDWMSIGLLAAAGALGVSFVPFSKLTSLLPGQGKTSRVAGMLAAIEHVVAAADYCRDCGCEAEAFDLEANIARVAACRGAK